MDPRASNGPQRPARKHDFAVERRRLRSPQIDAQPAPSPLDALAKGLVAIGERFRARPTLRVL